MIEVELTCICPRIKIPDLGLSMVKGDRVYLTQTQARSSRDLELLREKAVVVKLVKRRQGMNLPSPARGKHAGKHPGQERIRDKPVVEPAPASPPASEPSAPPVAEPEPVEPVVAVKEISSKPRGRKKYSVAPVFDAEGEPIKQVETQACTSDSLDSSSTN